MAAGGSGVPLVGRVQIAIPQYKCWNPMHHGALARIMDLRPCMLDVQMLVCCWPAIASPSSSKYNQVAVCCRRRSSRRRAASAGWQRCARCASDRCSPSGLRGAWTRRGSARRAILTPLKRWPTALICPSRTPAVLHRTPLRPLCTCSVQEFSACMHSPKERHLACLWVSVRAAWFGSWQCYA